jgi:hypothetical protein
LKFFSRSWGVLRSIIQFRVQRWYVALRGGTDDLCVLAYLENDTWYCVLLEFITWNCIPQICDGLSHIPLPKFVCNWKRKWGGPNDEEVYTLEQWCGDNLGCLWHLWIESPILQFVWKFKDRNVVEFEMSLEEARGKFAHNPKVLKWVETYVEELK